MENHFYAIQIISYYGKLLTCCLQKDY